MTAPAAATAATPTVAVSGRGRREVRPDRVEFHLVLDGVHPTVRDAEDRHQRRRAGLLAALAAHRDHDARLTADGPVITPQRDYEHHAYVFKGFRAREHVILRAPLEPGHVNRVLNALATQLADLTLDVRFTARTTAAALRSARAEAVRDARRKATHFAEAAGHRLGRLLRLSDTPPVSDHAGGRSDVLCEDMAPASVEIDPETQAITAEVHAIWELLPA